MTEYGNQVSITGQRITGQSITASLSKNSRAFKPHTLEVKVDTEAAEGAPGDLALEGKQTILKSPTSVKEPNLKSTLMPKKGAALLDKKPLATQKSSSKENLSIKLKPGMTLQELVQASEAQQEQP